MNDMRWIDGHWRPAGSMTRANYDRIMRELPTASMRKILVDTYGDKVIGTPTAEPVPKGRGKKVS